MIKQKIKRSHYYLTSVLLIFLFACFLTIIYTNNASKKISSISKIYFEKELYKSLNNAIKVAKHNNNWDLLDINKNDAGEILYVDYDLKNTYKVLNDITKSLYNQNDFEKVTLTLPFLIGSNNLFLVSLGPKIIVQLNYTDAVIANIHTKITNYGLNNALVQVYIKVTINGQMISPLKKEDEKIEYDLLVASKIINGRIPFYYGNSLTKDSKFFGFS